jgi:hypothetical protein
MSLWTWQPSFCYFAGVGMPRCPAQVGTCHLLCFFWALEFGGMGPLLGPSQAWGGVCLALCGKSLSCVERLFRCGVFPGSALLSWQIDISPCSPSL